MTTKDLERLIKKNVLLIISEIMSDPDFGLEYKKSFIRKVKKSLKEINKKRTYSLKDLKV